MEKQPGEPADKQITISRKCFILDLHILPPITFNPIQFPFRAPLVVQTCEYLDMMNHLSGSSETDRSLAKIVDGVPLSQEGITKDGEWSGWCWEVHSHECRDARTLNLEDIIISRDAEVMATKSECNIWKRVTLIALNGVLPIVSLLCAHLLVQEISQDGWESNEGSSGVQDYTSALELSGRITIADGVKVDLPVGLASQWDVDHLASVGLLINATECSRGLSFSIAEGERENGLIQKTLVNHVVKWWGNLVDGDGVKTKT